MDSNAGAANAAAAASILGGMMFTILMVTLVLTVFFVWCFWRVFQKAGYNGAMGLLCLIPSVGPLICLLVLAFGTWPNQRIDAFTGTPIGGVPMTPPPAV